MHGPIFFLTLHIAVKCLLASSTFGQSFFPGEAVLAVVAPLVDREHIGVGRAGEEQVPHLEAPQSAQPPALPRAAEALQAAVALGPHGGGEAGGPRGLGRRGGAPAVAALRLPASCAGRSVTQSGGGRGGEPPGRRGAGHRSPEGTAAPPGARASPRGGGQARGPAPRAGPSATSPRLRGGSGVA